jgi:hypothetical protein
MMNPLINIIKRKAIFLFLLPVFFVLHGCVENYDYIPLSDALLLTGLYFSVSLIFLFIFRLVYKNFTKAGLAAFLLMAFHFFFGSVYDTLQKLFTGSFITKYSFILPAAAVLFITAFIIIKKSKTNFSRTRLYLNSLFLLLILADTAILTGKIFSSKKIQAALPSGFTICDTCQKPDIYFILADEYAGNTELKEKFGFDNSVFLAELTQRKFHTIANSSSNYNYTPFSMASILNMEYLALASKDRGQSDLTYCYESIKNSTLLRFLQQHNYRLYNYSIFDFEGQPGRRLEKFLPVKTRLITAQTFLSRAENSILFNVVTKLKSKAAIKKLTYAYKHTNEKIYALTWDLAREKPAQPKFVYTHLELPHYPYYYDKNGAAQPFERLVEGNQVNKTAYVEYLQYSNKKLVALVDHILQASPSPPIIILMGDHGFRHFTEPVEEKYYFMNLSTVFLPSGNYTAFNDSITGVNLFRAILNTQYGQQLPFLKDSTSYLKD